MRYLLASLIMAISVLHTTPSDATFSAAGAAAWDEEHTVGGFATVAQSGDYANLTGTPVIPSLADAWPIGSVFTSVRTTSPATILGFGTWASLGEGHVLVAVATAIAQFNTVKASGGALTAASSGTVSTPTFTGDAYTPSGANAISLTKDAVAGSNAISLTRDAVAGSNAIALFREAAAGANAASVASGSVSVEWPTGVPTFDGTAHQHGLPISHIASGGAVYFAGAASAWGSGTTVGMNAKVTTLGANASSTNIISIVSVLGVPLSQTATAAGIISWPATAPSAVIKNATAAAQTFTGVTGSVSGQTFTGVTASVSGQVFTGVTASVSGQVFTGVAKAPTGAVSKPEYVGDETSIVQPFICVYFWERTA